MLIKPLVTEKTTNLLSDNIVVFLVKRESTKDQIKEEFESKYGVKVDKVRTLIDPKGRKKAYIKVSKEFNVEKDLAKKIGIF